MRKQKRRGLIFGMLALSLAIFTGFMFASQVQGLEKKIGDMQQVVVVKNTIQARSLITADMLETRQIPRMYANPSYIQTVAEIANQRVAVGTLDSGEIVRQGDVAPTSGLNDGSRALSIGVNPISVQVDRVQTGSHVDVIVSYETTDLDKNGQEVKSRRTITLLQDVEVLAVAGEPQIRATTTDSTDKDAKPQSSSSGALGGLFNMGSAAPSNNGGSFVPGNGLRDTVVVATLKVSPEDAQKLAYADTFASDIRLALRRPDDRAVEPFPPVSEEDFR